MSVGAWGGIYTERGRWRDDRGNAGVLEGRVIVRATPDSLTFSYEDDHVMTSGPLEGASARIAGEGGGTTSAGTIYLADASLVLEYMADVRGREERNTDVWSRHGERVMRAGLIRQADRTIWFEAEMVKAGPDA